MKIILDSAEVSNIVNSWARNKYKTNNVSVALANSDISITLEVMLNEDVGFSEKLATDSMMQMMKKHRGIEPTIDATPDLSGPPLEAGTTSLLC